MPRAWFVRAAVVLFVFGSFAPRGASGAALCDITDPVMVAGSLVRSLDRTVDAVEVCPDPSQDDGEQQGGGQHGSGTGTGGTTGSPSDASEHPSTVQREGRAGATPEAARAPPPGVLAPEPAFMDDPGPTIASPVATAAHAPSRAAGVVAGALVALVAAGWIGFVLGRRRGVSEGSAVGAEAARSLERMKTEILANVGHELRTPLTSALGFARLVQTRELSRAQRDAFVCAIVDAGEKLERVIDLLIAVATVEGGRALTTTDRMDLAQLIREAVARWQPRAPKHVLTARVEGAFSVTSCNAALLRQLVDELLDNAIKFSPDGGIVTVGLAQEPGLLTVRVADQGIGIAPEQLARLFEDFRQGDPSATRRFGGLGLGLAFARRVAIAHGGTITAASEPGRGSTFTVQLPARRPANDPSRRRRTPSAPRFTRVPVG